MYEQIEPILSFDEFIAAFPRIKRATKKLAEERLPLCPSVELAAIAAALMSDGHIDWYACDGRPRARKIILYSSKKAECAWFLGLVKKAFGFDGKLSAYAPNHNNWRVQPYKAVVHSAFLARALILAGVPAGNKTEKEFLVPKWIIGGNKEIKRAFLRTFFTFEGGKPQKKPKSFSFQISLSAVKRDDLLQNGICYMNQLKSLLNDFCINTSKIGYYPKNNGFKKSNTVLHFSIMDQISIVKFYQNIGYFSGEKQEALKKAVYYISKFGRIKAISICKLIKELKDRFGTDKKLTSEVNKFAGLVYTSRQIEHFRRNEATMPIELLFTLIKIKKDEKILDKLPDYVKILYEFGSHRSLFPSMNSSTICLATESGNC